MDNYFGWILHQSLYPISDKKWNGSNFWMRLKSFTCLLVSKNVHPKFYSDNLLNSYSSVLFLTRLCAWRVDSKSIRFYVFLRNRYSNHYTTYLKMHFQKVICLIMNTIAVPPVFSGGLIVNSRFRLCMPIMWTLF